MWDRFCIFFENARALCSTHSAVTSVYPLGGHISLLKVCLFFPCLLFETCGVGRFIFLGAWCWESLLFFFCGGSLFQVLNQRRMHVLLQVVAMHCTLNAGLSSKWKQDVSCTSILPTFWLHSWRSLLQALCLQRYFETIMALFGIGPFKTSCNNF